MDCLGESCQSLRVTNGGCFASSVIDSASCDSYASANGLATSWVVTDVSSTCALVTVSDESDCSMVSFLLSFLFFS